MGKAEAKVEDYLRKRVKETGGKCRKLRFIGRRGALDNLCWWRFPNVAVVECKAEGEDIDLSSPQGRTFVGMRDDGWPAYVVSSHAEVDALLATIMEETEYA